LAWDLHYKKNPALNENEINLIFADVLLERFVQGVQKIRHL